MKGSQTIADGAGISASPVSGVDVIVDDRK